MRLVLSQVSLVGLLQDERCVPIPQHAIVFFQVIHINSGSHTTVLGLIFYHFVEGSGAPLVLIMERDGERIFLKKARTNSSTAWSGYRVEIKTKSLLPILRRAALLKL